MTTSLQYPPDSVDDFISQILTLVSVIIFFFNMNNELCIGIVLTKSDCIYLE